MIRRIRNPHNTSEEAPWYLCLVVGALSAVVGIGGAIVLNPMMVKRGIEVQWVYRAYRVLGFIGLQEFRGLGSLGWV